MKINKFKKHLELLGLRLAPLRSKRFAVQTVIGSRNIAYISEKTQYVFSTDTEYFHNNAFDNQETLYLLLKEYAETPLEEREEEKKYYVKLNNPILKEFVDDFDSHFLNRGISTSYFLADEDQENGYQTQFTQKEIDDFPDEVKAVLPLCEKIEVTSND